MDTQGPDSSGRECAEETEPEGDLMALAEGVEVSD